MRGVLGAALSLSLLATPVLAASVEIGGVTEWQAVPGGKLKAQVYVGPQVSAHPVLVVVLHGDAPFAKPRYQYDFARQAATSGDVVAAAILRPGYTDAVGDTSSGVHGLTTGDNYTRDRIEMIAAAIRGLRDAHSARAVVLVGHSGGAALAADLLALHPELAKVALLVSCPCDLGAWRAHMKALQHGDPIWDRPVASLSSLDLAPRVPKGDKVRMMVGSADEVAPPDLTQRYAAALAGRGVDVEITQLPGKDHEIFLEPEVQAALKALLAAQSSTHF